MINLLKKWFSSTDELSTEQIDFLRKQKYMWILDPGHGALTKGKRSPITSDGRQLFEYEFNHDIARQVHHLLKGLNIKSVLTIKNPSSTGNALLKRVMFANLFSTPLPKIFVSIHGNAGNAEGFSTEFGGIETFYYSTVGKKIADVFQSELIKKTKLRNRGIKKGNFYVLKYTDHPAILTENGFFNNPNEFELMMTQEYRRKVAMAHVAAIQRIENSDL